MKQFTSPLNWSAAAVSVLISLLLVSPAKADTLLTDFDNFFFFDEQFAWNYPTPVETNWTISATGFGYGVTRFYEEDNFTPKIIDGSAENTIEFTVTISDTVGQIGPLIVLFDDDGTERPYVWHGLGNGTHVLTSDLNTPSFTGQPGDIPGMDWTNLAGFYFQVDPEVNTNRYTITAENLRLLFVEPPAPQCDTLISDFNNTGVLGGYAAWAGNIPAPQPDNWTITATGFGGGWQDISPNLDALGETTMELAVTVTNANGLVGPIVVLQDGDGTQLTWPWYGLTNGSYVLTAPLSAGNVVSNQLGGVPGMNFGNLDWFHVQVDDGGSNVTYTVTFENLRLFGFDPTITDFAFDPTSNQFDLIWNSRSNRMYSVSYASDLTGAFSLLKTNLPSDGTRTTNSVVVPAGDVGFLKVFEECE